MKTLFITLIFLASTNLSWAKSNDNSPRNISGQPAQMKPKAGTGDGHSTCNHRNDGRRYDNTAAAATQKPNAAVSGQSDKAQ